MAQSVPESQEVKITRKMPYVTEAKSKLELGGGVPQIKVTMVGDPEPERGNRLLEIIDEVRKEEGIDPDSHHLLMNMDEKEIAR